MTARPRPSDHFDHALLILRLVAGSVFTVHGYQKIFVFGFAGVTDMFTKIGAPLPGLSGPGVSILEFAGGIALLIGLLGRIVPVLLAIDMLGAIVLVHFKNGFSMPTGYEFALTLLGICVALALVGPGRFAVEAMRRRP